MGDSSASESSQQPSSNNEIVAAISSMSSMLAASFENLHKSMETSFGEMRTTIEDLSVESNTNDEDEDLNSLSEDEDNMAPRAKSAKLFEQKNSQQSGPSSPQTSSTQSQQSGATEEPKSSEAQIEVLSGIATNLKLVQKKGPAVNKQIADIVQGLMRVKLSDEVLTETQNRYNRPENCDCLETTKVNHLIWDKLKSETRSSDIKLQRVQTNLVKGVIPIVSLIEKLINSREKIGDVFDVDEVVKKATDSIALIGAANFDLNMRRRDNIKHELNEDYKHLCSSTIPFTD